MKANLRPAAAAVIVLVVLLTQAIGCGGPGKPSVAPVDAFWPRYCLVRTASSDTVMDAVVTLVETAPSGTATVAPRLRHLLATTKELILSTSRLVRSLHPPVELNAVQRSKLREAIDDLALAQDERVQAIDAWVAYIDNPQASLLVAAKENCRRANQLVLSGVTTIDEVAAELGIALPE